MSKDIITIKNIYNKNNVLVTSENIEEILRLGNIDLKINDISIWRLSFVHKSYCKTHRKRKNLEYSSDDSSNSDLESDISIINLQDNSNERLEWLGDGIIQGVVATYLFNRYDEEDEGFLTKLRSKLVKTEGLSKLAKCIGLSKYILMSKHVEKNCNGRNKSKILENTFESFIGAIYEYFKKYKNDLYAYDITFNFLINVIEKYIDITELIRFDDNYKDILMRLYQKDYNGSYPIYKELSVMNEPPNRIFEMCVYDPESSTFLANGGNESEVKDRIVGKGSGKSKKEAEKIAAENALKYFNVIT